VNKGRVADSGWAARLEEARAAAAAEAEMETARSAATWEETAAA
jgi:hypothetical protein